MERIRIEGIKLSNELVGINFENSSRLTDYVSRFTHVLTENQVNLNFLSITNRGVFSQAFCCIGSGDRPVVEELLTSYPDPGFDADFTGPVGSLSVFTHQFSLKILGLILTVFGKTPLPLYGLASSLSVITCITDYTLLKQAVTAMLEYFHVSPDHISFEPEIQVKQTKYIKQ
ncbi:MAG: hypothetical protein SV686_09695 [Thermodesulfobacteriota bacterium]|nr:hypothetical protein [Thermodesulfobacteriota bacterium]